MWLLICQCGVVQGEERLSKNSCLQSHPWASQGISTDNLRMPSCTVKSFVGYTEYLTLHNAMQIAATRCWSGSYKENICML